MAGPIGHRREKEMNVNKLQNIYKKFTLHSEPAEVDEVAQMRFPPVLVFSSIHPISKIFVATISNQFFFPTVCRTSGIARPRRSPSQYTFNPSVRREARHIPCELPIMSADRLRPRLTPASEAKCATRSFQKCKIHASLNSNLRQVEVQQFVGTVSCKTRPCSANHFYTMPDVQQQNMPRYQPPCRSISALLQSILGGIKIQRLAKNALDACCK